MGHWRWDVRSRRGEGHTGRRGLGRRVVHPWDRDRRLSCGGVPGTVGADVGGVAGAVGVKVGGGAGTAPGCSVPTVPGPGAVACVGVGAGRAH